MAIVAIGTELVQGHHLDTNSFWLAGRLRDMGLRVVSMQILPDDATAISETIQAHLANGRSCVLCGGLGPTEDDRTRQAAASALGVDLQINPSLLAYAENWYRERQRPVPAHVQRHASIPVGSTPLRNVHGTAHSFMHWQQGEDGMQFLSALPGVPRELKGMFADTLAPALTAMLRLPAILTRTLDVVGFNESTLNAQVQDLLREAPGLEASILVSSLLLKIRWQALDASRHAEVHRRAQEALRRLGDAVYRDRVHGAVNDDTGDQADPLAEAMVSICRERGIQLTVSESCTGGLLASLITGVPGASQILDTGLVSYAEATKSALLAVPPHLIHTHGVVSPTVARAMARGAIALTNWMRAEGHAELSPIDLAVGITGVAGPDSDARGTPVGTVWIGLANRAGDSLSYGFRFPGAREQVRLYAARSALALLRLAALADCALPAPEVVATMPFANAHQSS